MATNYTYIDYGGYHIIKTKASNIYLISLNRQYGEDKYISDARDALGKPYYGMNASFFKTSTSALCNIAYQDGRPVGPDTQGSTNADGCGASIVCWDRSKLKLYDGVTSGSSSYIPTLRGTWAQGGINLNLWDTNWVNKFKEHSDPDLLNGISARTGILINTNSNEVYLFMTPAITQTVANYRDAIKKYIDYFENSSGTQWQAILTDGGASAQMVCADVDVRVLLKSRPVPQIIALKDTN